MFHPPSPRSFLTALLDSIPHDPSNASTSSNSLTSLRSSKDRSAILTLHVLFPNELLPALDLLDRALLTRMRIVPEDVLRIYQQQQQHREQRNEVEDQHPQNQDEQQQKNPELEHPESQGQTQQQHSEPAPPPPNLAAYPTVHHVRSAQPSKRARYPSTATDDLASAPSYEVRLEAWNCSCPAFAFAAFPPGLSSAQTRQDDAYEDDTAEEGDKVEEDSTEVEDHDDRARRWGGWSLGEGDPPVCKHLLACVLGERCELFAGGVRERVVGVDEAAGWAAGWGA